MKHEFFVEQPNIELKPGIRVNKNTKIKFASSKVKQKVIGLVLRTVLEEEGNNGINTYKTKSEIIVKLNEGDILLFDEQRGYYLSPYPMTSIDDAIGDIESLRNIKAVNE